jgi:hypothetical protein
VDRLHKDFDCERCQWGHHCTEEPMQAWPRSVGPAPYPMFVMDGVIESRTCLKPMVRPEARAMIKLYPYYLDGHLARAGGVLDQPNAYIEAMGVIRAHMAEVKREH